MTDGRTTDLIDLADGRYGYLPTNGDVVIYGEKEFIWVELAPYEDNEGNTINPSHWEELGDLTRTAALETLVGSLYAEKRTNSEFVTHIENDNGKYTVKTARPTVDDVLYYKATTEDDNDLTAKDKFDTIDAALEKKLEVHQNAFSTCIVVGQAEVKAESPGDALTFIGNNIAITTDPRVNEVAFEVNDATNSTAGIVKLSDDIAGEVKENVEAALPAAAAGKTAATPRAVQLVNTKVEAVTTTVENIASNYVKFSTSDNKLYVGTTGSDEIIFDCGGAPTK